ncbi:FhaA domain-containing protein [Aeromicrobium massiliense]|uniref:FhaA domain-containing protein n=1 Tax=Aeromicrobium massiliense TaxID=1464554 RepID=UPI0005768E29|nr:FhaA domain-containing protein [Aeromicrobium massiliense]
MPGSLSAVLSNLLVLALLVAVVYLLLRVGQAVFRTDTKRAAAGEVAAKLVTLPAGSDGVLRRRFVRAITGQHVVMPSGERLAFGSLVVRVAPEDVVRLDPDEDLERLGADAARLYAAHAERQDWSVPADVRVQVEVDPSLRAGWIPPARGGAAAASRAAAPAGWSVLRASGEDEAGPEPRRVPVAEPATTRFPALVQDLPDTGTMPVVAMTVGLRLEHGDDAVELVAGEEPVLGRVKASALRLGQPEVSYRHATLRHARGEWQVKDLGSTNGTTLDGERLVPDVWTTLRPGAALALAGVVVTVTAPAPGTVPVRRVPTVR